MGRTLERRVADYAAEHDLLPAGAAVLALVSGGADSTCLMHILARAHDGPVGVLTLDHGLRREAAEEARAVVAAAAVLGLPADLERLRVAPGARLQERARDARLAAARRVADERGYDLIATGHTASDQVETVLFRIARGAGRTGALGMAPREGDRVRPLLCVSASETRDWCARRGLAVVDDPTNADPRFARARVRHGLLPALEAVHPGAELSVARFADLLRDEADLLDDLVDAAWRRCAGGGGLRTEALGGEHPALARLLARRLLDEGGVAADSSWVRRALALARAGGRPIQAPGGLIAVDRGVLVVEPAPGPEPPEIELPIPGAATFGGVVVRARAGAATTSTPTRVAVRIAGPLTVRGPRPGDRLALGSGGSQAVGRLLAAAGVPARHRGHVPVVSAGPRVVWVAGHRADPTLLAPPEAQAILLEVSAP